MKKFLPFLSIALVTVACNTEPKESAAPANVWQQQAAANPAPAIDTAGLASYQAWKAGNELTNTNQHTSEARVVASKPRVITKYVHVPAKPAPVAAAPASASASTSDDAATGNGSMTSESGNTAKAEQKKGWSKAAKGAVIGGIGGAVGGAVLDKKNRVAGAVIGAVIGAGGGYAIGKGMDKKDGRIEYVNK